MSITQEMVAAAQDKFTEIQADIFFRKLASLGITPANEDEARQLWELGDSYLQEYPRQSDAGTATKQASFEAFGDKSSVLANDGCSADAHKIVDELCKNPELVKAAHILLAVNNS